MSKSNAEKYLSSFALTFSVVLAKHSPLIRQLSFSQPETVNFAKFCDLLCSLKLEDTEKFLSSFLEEQQVADALSFIKQDAKYISDYCAEAKQIEEAKKKKLISINWRLVTLSPLSAVDSVEPWILLNLLFSDGTEKIIKSSFLDFKKMQEDFQSAVKSFEGSYARKVINFAK